MFVVSDDALCDTHWAFVMKNLTRIELSYRSSLTDQSGTFANILRRKGTEAFAPWKRFFSLLFKFIQVILSKDFAFISFFTTLELSYDLKHFKSYCVFLILLKRFYSKILSSLLRIAKQEMIFFSWQCLGFHQKFSLSLNFIYRDITSISLAIFVFVSIFIFRNRQFLLRNNLCKILEISCDKPSGQLI